MKKQSKKRSATKRQPPVSLHPLRPEEALAGLMRVKPAEKETPAKSEREQEAKQGETS